MRLFHVTTVPETLGFLRGQVGFMRSRGFEVHAVSSPGADLCQFGEQEFVTVHGVDMPRAITPLQDVGAVVRLWRILQRLRPAIVHTHTPKGGLLGLLAAWLTRVPVRIYHIHGLPLMTASGGKRRLLTWTERVSCLCAHRVLCVSPSVRQAAIDLHLCSESKVVVLASGTVNGIDAQGAFNPNGLSCMRSDMRQRYGIPDEALVIGFVGRIVHDKGVEDLVAAWERLRGVYTKVHLIFVGAPEPQDPIATWAEAVLNSDERVHLTGHLDNIPPLYALMDVVVLPSHREGFPYVPMEAGAMGLPVVSTRVPGCVDAVLDGVTGTLVPPYDPQALVEAISRYLDDPALRCRHGQAGRERVLRDFRPEDIWEATYQQYVRLLRAKGLPVPYVIEAQK